MTNLLDLAAIEARCNAAKNSADPIKHYGIWKVITDALADIPALIARVRELEKECFFIASESEKRLLAVQSERDALKAENARISGILENFMSMGPDKMIAEAVAAERSECAKIAESCPGFQNKWQRKMRVTVATAIRARGEKEIG